MFSCLFVFLVAIHRSSWGKAGEMAAKKLKRHKNKIGCSKPSSAPLGVHCGETSTPRKTNLSRYLLQGWRQETGGWRLEAGVRRQETEG